MLLGVIKIHFKVKRLSIKSDSPIVTCVLYREYNSLKEAGILKVSDIFQDREKLVLNKLALERIFNLSINYMKCNRLINCVS